MSATTYWGGSSVTGKIRPLEIESFKDLVALLGSKPVFLPYTRPEWTAMAQAVADAAEAVELDKNPETQAEFRRAKDTYDNAKDGPYVCACSFKPGTEKRNDTNADQLLLACFDIDDSDLARDFVESPETLSEALYPYNFIAYTTASSTPENPRLRIIVELDPCDPEHHKRIVFYLAHRRLGLPREWKGRRESNTLSLPFYRPVKLEGEEFTSIIASRTTGDAFELIDLPAEVDEEVERTYGYKGEVGDEDDLDNMPISGITVDDIREPLFRIDASCKYQPWCEIACALRHQFRGEDEAEEAFHLFCDWSETGDNFRGVEDCFAKWKSFQPDFRGQRPITLKSLFKHATDAGWKNTKIAAKIELSVSDRIKECDDVSTLTNEAAKWIAAIPFQNQLTQDSLYDELRNRIADLTGKRPNLASIRKQVEKERKVVKFEANTGNIPGWLRPWCYVFTADRFYNTISGRLVTPEAFNRMYGEEMMPKDSPGDTLATNRPMIQPADFALNTEGMIRKVDAVVYDPRYGGETQFFRIPGEEGTYVNSYRQNTLPRLDEKNSRGALSALKKLLKALIADEEDRLHFLDWLAYLVQFPGKKIRHTPFLQGVQGCGKTMISRYAMAALGGKANCKIIGPKEISSNFNDWATGAQLVTVEEIWVQGKDRWEIMNSLKPLTTNDDIVMTKKHHDSVTLDNVTNYIAFSNHHNALSLEPGDRRWWVLKSPLQSEHQKLELEATMINGKPFFKYHGMIFEKYAGAVRHALLNYEIRSSFNPDGDAPKTPWRTQVIHESKNKLLRQIEEVLTDGHLMVDSDIIFQPALERQLDTHLMRNAHPTEHYLYNLGFQPWGGPSARFPINGSGKGRIWVHRDLFDECSGDPHEILMERHDNSPEDII